MDSAELNIMQKNIKAYYEHFTRNRKSLIARILGIYIIEF